MEPSSSFKINHHSQEERTTSDIVIFAPFFFLWLHPPLLMLQPYWRTWWGLVIYEEKVGHRVNSFPALWCQMKRHRVPTKPHVSVILTLFASKLYLVAPWRPTVWLSYLYGKTWLCVYVCVCVIRMDGLMLTKISEWIAIYLGGNIRGLKFTPHLSKWSPPPDETFGRPLLSNISGAT